MGETVTCSVCGDDVGKLGIGKHADMHRREFKEDVGRWPEGYDEVREWGDGRVFSDQERTLDDFAAE